MLRLPKVRLRVGIPIAIVVGLVVALLTKVTFFPGGAAEQITTAQSTEKDVPALKDKDVPAPKDKDVPAPKDKDVPAPKDKDVPAPKDKDVPAPKDKGVPAPKAKELTLDEQKARFRAQIKDTTPNRRGQVVIDVTPEVSENAVNGVAKADGWFVQKGVDGDRNATTWILTKTKR